jgi:hypothetical protein
LIGCATRSTSGEPPRRAPEPSAVDSGAETDPKLQTSSAHRGGSGIFAVLDGKNAFLCLYELEAGRLDLLAARSIEADLVFVQFTHGAGVDQVPSVRAVRKLTDGVRALPERIRIDVEEKGSRAYDISVADPGSRTTARYDIDTSTDVLRLVSLKQKDEIAANDHTVRGGDFLVGRATFDAGTIALTLDPAELARAKLIVQEPDRTKNIAARQLAGDLLLQEFSRSGKTQTPTVEQVRSAISPRDGKERAGDRTNPERMRLSINSCWLSKTGIVAVFSEETSRLAIYGYRDGRLTLHAVRDLAYDFALGEWPPK